jgi:hypothetical protein
MEAALDRFRAADTQVLGVSIDSVFSHANWGRDLGGVSFPLLADFEPKGAVAKSFGHYLEKAGITDRATVIVDKDGVIRYSVSVTPGGQRNVDELLAECEKVNGGTHPVGANDTGRCVPEDTLLYVKSGCGPSRKALLCLDNLRLGSSVRIANVTEDATAAADLKSIGGKDQAPCLVMAGEPSSESDAIVRQLVELVSPLP